MYVWAGAVVVVASSLTEARQLAIARVSGFPDVKEIIRQTEPLVRPTPTTYLIFEATHPLGV